MLRVITIDPARREKYRAELGSGRLLAHLRDDDSVVVSCGSGGDPEDLTQSVEPPEGGSWVPIPELRPRVACHIHVAGPSGAGKSTFANTYAAEFKRQTGGMVIVISADAEPDPALTCVDGRIQVDPSLAELDLEQLASPERPSLIIFDDTEGLPKPLATALRVFTQAIKERGRKMGLHTLSIYHKGAGNLVTRDSLAEATAYVVFPQRLTSNAEYMLKKYAGIPTEICSLFRKGGWGRWMMIFPGEAIVTPERIVELDGAVLASIAKAEKRQMLQKATDAAAMTRLAPTEGSAADRLVKSLAT